MSADQVTAAASVVGVLIGIGAVVVAYWQLGNLNTTLKMNALAVVLQLEAEMNARKEKVEQTAAAIRKESIAEAPNMKLIEILNDEMEGYLENWLNSAERLAYCITHGYLAERDWKAEYREYFFVLVKNHEEKFRADTIYTNLLDLVNKWKREP